MEKNNRTYSVDIAKGILIILVVVAHAQTDIVHDIIFMFHMPLFFMISGFLMGREKLLKTGYESGKIKHLMIPYIIYLVLDMVFIQKTLSVHDWIYALWGGRAVTGVYWYITCFLFTMFMLSALLETFSDRTIKGIVLIGGIAVIESHFVDKIHLLQFPGTPWNLDVSLMALVYVGIGFFYKQQIKKWIEEDKKKYNIIVGLITAGLIAFCWFIYRDGNRLYYFDMKPVYYKELISALLIPCAFGMVLVRLVHWIGKIKWLDGMNQILAFCGQATIPIMFMHIPLNHWQTELAYGRSVYVLIGVGIPVVFTVLFNKNKVMRKLFGLPDLEKFG